MVLQWRTCNFFFLASGQLSRETYIYQKPLASEQSTILRIFLWEYFADFVIQNGCDDVMFIRCLFLIFRYGIGMIYYKQEKFNLAEILFRKALSINPSSSVLFCHVGVVSCLLQLLSFVQPVSNKKIGLRYNNRPSDWSLIL